jgi:hypothetical protein
MDKKLIIWLGIALGIGGILYYALKTGLLLPSDQGNVDDPIRPGSQKKYLINYITPWGSADNPEYGYTEISISNISDFSIGEMVKTTNSRFPGPMAITDIWDSGSGHGSLKFNIPFTGDRVMSGAGWLMKV